MARKMCSIQIITDSNEEIENTFQEVKGAADDIVWSKYDKDGRLAFSGMCKAWYSKRTIMAENVISAFLLIIDNRYIKHIRVCTEAEGRRILRNDWTVTLREICAFIVILYGRVTYEAKNL